MAGSGGGRHAPASNGTAGAEIESIRRALMGGDRRSIGLANALADTISESSALFDATIALLDDADPRVRMRSADAVEKASRRRPDLLRPHKRCLLDRVSLDGQQEVRWHLLQLLPRLDLSPDDRDAAFALAVESLQHKSRIVGSEALSAMFALSRDCPALYAVARRHAEQALDSAAPAMRSRAKRLLELEPPK